MTRFTRRATVWLMVFAIAGAALRLVAIANTLPWWLHDPLVYFPTVLWALFGLAAIVVLQRRGSARPALLLAGVGVLMCNVAADLRLPRSSPPVRCNGQVLRLLSWNIFQARLADEEILALVRDVRPDVLLLQEVPPWYFRGHEKELRGLFRHVEYGNCLLAATDLDVVARERIDLSHGRSLMRLGIHHEGRRFDVFTTHLSVAMPKNFFSRLREQLRQTDQVLARLAETDRPVLIAGDWNFPLHSTGYRRMVNSYPSARLAGGWGFGYTFNAFLPLTAIDHCFASREVRFLGCTALPIRLSDHRPLLVEFTIEEEAS